MTDVTRRASVWRKHYAIPPEHGAWFWLLGPLALGVAAADRVTPELGLLLVAALAAFLARQPLTLLAKVAGGRRGRADLRPALFWLAVYGGVAVVATAGLVWAGHARVLWLAVPGAPIFAYYLLLVARKEERGQVALETAGGAVLALAAPAAYWTCGGESGVVAWTLYGLMVLHIAASIVGTHWRLAMRRRKEAPPPRECWRTAAPALAFHAANAGLSLALVPLAAVPWPVPLAFGIVLADALEGAAHPPVGVKPSRIGIRQLVVSVSFVVLVALGY